MGVKDIFLKFVGFLNKLVRVWGGMGWGGMRDDLVGWGGIGRGV